MSRPRRMTAPGIENTRLGATSTNAADGSPRCCIHAARAASIVPQTSIEAAGSGSRGKPWASPDELRPLCHFGLLTPQTLITNRSPDRFSFWRKRNAWESSVRVWPMKLRKGNSARDRRFSIFAAAGKGSRSDGDRPPLPTANRARLKLRHVIGPVWRYLAASWPEVDVLLRRRVHFLGRDQHDRLDRGSF